MNNILKSKCVIGSLVIKNRIVMESMGNALSELDGSVSPEDIAFYSERAKGGVGLIMSEAVSVDSRTGRANQRNLCIDDDSHIPGFRLLTNELHKYKCAFFVELYHPGSQGSSILNGGQKMFSPSGIECKLVREPVCSMSLLDIAYITRKFVEGAVRCKEAGVDGVLIHAAHGYLINQFLSPYSNHRTDLYGGSTKNRARLAIDIIQGIRKACGDSFPIGIRISANEFLEYSGIPNDKGITLDLSKEYAQMFEQAGVNLIDVSSGIYETMNTAWEPTGFDQGWKIYLAKGIKSVVSVPVVCTSVIRDPAYAEQLLESGVCDFIGSARAHLADPEWSNKALGKNDNDIRSCISCLNCMKTLMEGEVKCSVNAQACHEMTRSKIRKNGKGRNVVVVGGGAAGMEAARILSIRGYRVTLFEKENKLGGSMNQAATPPHKEKIQWFTNYISSQLSKLGVSIRLGVDATPELVASLNPYAVFIAAGACPLIPSGIDGIHRQNVCTAFDILSGNVKPKNSRVIVIGAGMTGLETAEFLLQNNNIVSVYDMLPEVAQGEHFQNIIDIEKRLGDVPQHTSHKLLEISTNGCVFENRYRERIFAPCDYVVLSMGMKPRLEFAKQFENMPNFRIIGTNVKYSGIAKAVESGFIAAYNLK
ncbi:MAG: FAD-dependent oxidoreductase [Christensenellaceae bacterium]